MIFGSALLKDGAINTALASQAAETLGIEHLTFAIDSRKGKVAIQGWKESTSVDPKDMVRALDQYCSAFLYTHIDTEGTMTGFPIDGARELAALTKKQMIVAGGIRSHAEVDQLDAIGVDAVVGMAIYTGAMSRIPPLMNTDDTDQSCRCFCRDTGPQSQTCRASSSHR